MLGAQQPVGNLVLPHAVVAGQTSAFLVSGRGRTKVLLRLTVENPLRDQAAMVHSGTMAMLFQRSILQLGPPLSLVVHHVSNFGPLAMDRVQLNNLFPKRAIRRYGTRRQHDVSVPIPVMATSRFWIYLPVLFCSLSRSRSVTVSGS